MTIVINFGNILYWVALIFGGFFGLAAAVWIVNGLATALYNLPRDFRVSQEFMREAKEREANERAAQTHRVTSWDDWVWRAACILWFCLAIAFMILGYLGID